MYKLKDAIASKGYVRPFTGISKPEYSQGSAIDSTLFVNIPKQELLPHLHADEHDEISPMLRSERSHSQSLTCYAGRFAPLPLFPTIKEDNAHICFAAIHMLALSRGTVSLKSANPKDGSV